MQITPNEVASIEDIGMLDGSPVKMLRTKGGYHIAIARPKGKMADEAIGAGSHPAIVRYTIEKQFPGFQPAMQKSELASDSATVEKHSHFLNDTLRKSGHDIFSIQNGSEIQFQITKHNDCVHSTDGKLENGSLVIEKPSFDPKFTRAMAGAVAEKAMNSGAKKIRM